VSFLFFECRRNPKVRGLRSAFPEFWQRRIRFFTAYL